VARALCRLANAKHVHILMGSGTMANDAIGAEMASWSSAGVVLSNGEFGERLVDHAARFQLRFQTHRVPWGRAFERQTIETMLDSNPSLRWVWAVHGETSTGVLNDLAMLKDVTAARGLRLSIDAVSSLGTTPVDLGGVALASGVSGKGLGAFAGLAFVFREAAVGPASGSLPRCLDFGYAAEHGGMPFTISSILIGALKAALDGFEGERHFTHVVRLAARLRRRLRRMGLAPVAEPASFPAVTTIELPAAFDSVRVGQCLEEAGFLVHYRSEYLVTRNWLQICLMGECTRSAIDDLMDALGDTLTLDTELDECNRLHRRCD
jgi:aspartate aminotransferase-like enzyme